jgi:hypothetical protein
MMLLAAELAALLPLARSLAARSEHKAMVKIL